MAGLDRNAPIPTEIRLHQKSRRMELKFSDGKAFSLPYELLRVYSPSAEVRGHGPGQEVLQTGKRNVEILTVEPMGNYAIKPAFSDGHDTGIYSWDYLYSLGEHQEELWQDYLRRIEESGASREAETPAAGPHTSAGGCGHH
ncbi:MAG: DUF971 domain-containing protein [Rhodocyclaceae bacterium]